MVDSGARILAGRYEVGELIGRGGMAEVHVGHDTRLGRTVAIKILRSDLARDPSFQNRFRREAQAAAALNHPAIVAVYDTGEDVITEPTGVVAHVPFIVMEYVEGHTVRDILQNGHAAPIEEAVEITIGVLSALEYSHHAGIVHRDIKPANVMLTPTGAVKVMDFGIARAVADAASTMTQTQAVIGTAQYLSPEQARGETVDARSDLYSTGCLLFELLTGRPPFTGDSPVSVAYQHVREAAPVPSTFASDVPDALDRITLKALAKERDARYSTADEFRSDLEAVLRGGAVSAPAVGTAVVAAAAVADATQVMAPTVATTQAFPPTTATPAWGATGLGEVATVEEEDEHRRPWLIWVLVGIAVLAVAGIIALLLANNEDDPNAGKVAVPNVVGKTLDEARAQLDTLDLEAVPEEQPSDTVPAGQVISTTPAADTMVLPKTEVKVVVSTGPTDVKIPDVSGKTAEEATNILQGEPYRLKVNLNREEDNNPKFPAGQVTKTDPPADSPAKVGDSVTLYVSTGNVDLPSVIGQKQADAENTLIGLNLRPIVREVTTAENDPGTVISQDPDPGLVKQGTAVTIQVAVAPTNIPVPDVTGKSWSEAAQTLGQAGFTDVRRQDDNSDQVPPDVVIYTDPGANSVVNPSQPLIVHVSKGPQQQQNNNDGG